MNGLTQQERIGRFIDEVMGLDYIYKAEPRTATRLVVGYEPEAPVLLDPDVFGDLAVITEDVKLMAKYGLEPVQIPSSVNGRELNPIAQSGGRSLLMLELVS